MPYIERTNPNFTGKLIDVGASSSAFSVDQAGNVTVAGNLTVAGNVSDSRETVTGISNAYVPPGGFTKYKAALAKAKAGTGTCTIWGLGASLAPFGGGGTASDVTDLTSQSYGVQLRNGLLNAGYPLHGDTFLPTASGSYNPLVSYTQAPWTMDVSPASWLFDGPFTAPAWVVTTATLCHATHPTASLQIGNTGTGNARAASLFTFDLGNQDGGTSSNGRNWWAAIDATPNTGTNVSNTGSHLIVRTDFTGLANTATHALNIGTQSTTAVAVVPVAVSWFPSSPIPTSGVHFAWFGMPGSCSLSDLARTDGTGPQLRIERMLGPSNTPAGDPPSSPFTANAALNPPFQPDLVIIDEFDDFAFVGLPSASGSTPSYTVTGANLTEYLNGLDRMNSVFQRKSTGCDVVHIFPAIPDTYVSDITFTNTQQWNIRNYFKERKRFAEANGHGWLSVDAEFAGKGLTNGWQQASNPHYTKAGHVYVGGLLSSRLGLY